MNGTNNALEEVLLVLPNIISQSIRDSDIYKKGIRINEIRLRTQRNITLTVKGRNHHLKYKVTEQDMKASLMGLCRKSVYSYCDSIKEGYIPFSRSVRVGVCGNAVCEEGKVVNVSDVYSLNIRIPFSVPGFGRELYERLLCGGLKENAIIFSPPGSGKTTLLRNMALYLAGGHPSKRVSIIDSRYELCDERVLASENIDVYAGYPKAKGIELATRTMSPEYIICDEIGYEEAESIIRFQSSGVPIIIAAHASSLNGLINSGPSGQLYRAGIGDILAEIVLLDNGNRSLNIIDPRNINGDEL